MVANDSLNLTETVDPAKISKARSTRAALGVRDDLMAFFQSPQATVPLVLPSALGTTHLGDDHSSSWAETRGTREEQEEQGRQQGYTAPMSKTERTIAMMRRRLCHSQLSRTTSVFNAGENALFVNVFDYKQWYTLHVVWYVCFACCQQNTHIS